MGHIWVDNSSLTDIQFWFLDETYGLPPSAIDAFYLANGLQVVDFDEACDGFFGVCEVL